MEILNHIWRWQFRFWLFLNETRWRVNLQILDQVSWRKFVQLAFATSQFTLLILLLNLLLSESRLLQLDFWTSFVRITTRINLIGHYICGWQLILICIYRVNYHLLCIDFFLHSSFIGMDVVEVWFYLHVDYIFTI